MEINQNQQNVQKPSVAKQIAGITAGTMAAAVPSAFAQLPGVFILPEMKKLSTLTKDEFVVVDKALNQALKDTKLTQKGVEIVRANNPAVASIIENEVKNNKLAKFLSKIFPKKYSVTKQVNATKTMFELGMNAAYLPNAKKIILPEKSLNLAGFHEIGHAMNGNFSKIGRALQKCRPLMFLSVPIALIALLKNKKAEGEQPTGIIDKSTDFVKNNAGKLTFAAFLPTLIEEGMATLKGNKLAKALLNSNLAKKVLKTNKIAYITYAATAIGATTAVCLARKVKDSIAHNKVA